nr:MAG TPA_asm: hypothetical protein [Caudoviricetes sp.]
MIVFQGDGNIQSPKGKTTKTHGGHNNDKERRTAEQTF